MSFYILDNVREQFDRDGIGQNSFIRALVMYVGKLSGGVMISYQKIESSCTDLIGDPVEFEDINRLPPTRPNATNKLKVNKVRSSS